MPRPEKQTDVKKILAADIGGTHARFGFFEADPKAGLSLTAVNWLETKKSASFAELIKALVKSDFPLAPKDADAVVIAIAGPVEAGVRSDPPNISWNIDLSNAPNDFGFKRFFLINDFTAQAYACRSKVMEDASQILPGKIDLEAAAAVIGAGTGLGKAALAPDGHGGYVALPTEGGHSLFPFVTDREFEFFRFVQKTTGKELVIGDMVVSGGGLSLLHLFLTGENLSPAKVAATFSPRSETLAWAARFYGRTCRNFALETLAMGGVYVTGGVAAKTPVLVTHEIFAKEFRHSETHGELLRNIPVFLNVNQDSGLWGAAFLGQQKLARP